MEAKNVFIFAARKATILFAACAVGLERLVLATIDDGVEAYPRRKQRREELTILITGLLPRI
jgi:hypothetical protein